MAELAKYLFTLLATRVVSFPTPYLLQGGENTVGLSGSRVIGRLDG